MRAFAVLAVFADHLFGWPSGGFVGVDIFFVLSGFFISGLLIRERTATGKLSFQNFYVRRVKRILPSAVLVLTGTVVGSYVLFPAMRAKETLLDALYSTVSQPTCGSKRLALIIFSGISRHRLCSTTGRCRSKSNSTSSGPLS